MILYDIIWYYVVLYDIIWYYDILFIYWHIIYICFIMIFINKPQFIMFTIIDESNSLTFPEFLFVNKNLQAVESGLCWSKWSSYACWSQEGWTFQTHFPSAINQWWLFIFLDSWFQWNVLGPPQQPSFLNERSITFGCLTHQHTHLVSFHAKLAPILLATLWYFNTLQSRTSPFLVRYIIEQVSLAMTSSSLAASHCGYIHRFSWW